MFNSKYVMLFGLPFIAAFLVGSYLPQTPQLLAARLPSSVPHALPAEKQASAMSIEITGPETYSMNPTDEVELLASITQHLPGDADLSYKWGLPPGVTLSAGNLQGRLHVSALGQAQSLRIVVRGFSRDSMKKISLSTSLHKGDIDLKASGVVVSRPEDTDESKVMARRSSTSWH